MNLASLDLNLLVALDALLAEASVGRAAARIGLSQPATSHALRRLRDVMGDPLLVRVGARMELTPRAQALRGPLADTMTQLRGLFTPESFDPGDQLTPFRADDARSGGRPGLAAAGEADRRDRARRSARYTSLARPAIIGADFSRSIDIVLSCTGNAYPGFYRQRLYADKDALAVRNGHPLAARLIDSGWFSRRAPRRRGGRRSAGGHDRRMAAPRGDGEARRTGRAELSPSTADSLANRSRRLRASPPDRGVWSGIFT